MSKKKKNPAIKRLVVIALIVLLPVASLAIGFFGVQVLMEDQTSEPSQTAEKSTKELLEGDTKEAETAPEAESHEAAEPEEEAVEEETADEEALDEETMTYTFPSMKLYNIQVGSFSESANANKKALACEKEGYGAFTYQADNYKVFVMTFFDRHHAEVNQVIAAQTYEGAYISETVIAPGTLHYHETDKAYIHELKKDVENLNGLLQSFTNYVHTYDLAAFNPDDFSVYLITQHNEITKLREKIMGYTVSDELKEQHGAWIAYLERLEKHYQYLINLENPSRVDIWDQAMELLFDYAHIN